MTRCLTSSQIVALHALGWTEEAVSIGFYLWPQRSYAEGHHHARRAAYVHSLALVAQLRRDDLPAYDRERYRAQIMLNQAYVDEWAGHAAESYEHWSLLVQAELAALDGLPTAFSLYDLATNRAEEGAWLSDLGWCYFLTGSHLAKVGAVHLGTELQQRGVETHISWGASAVADYMSLQFRHASPRRHTRVDAAVQTDFDSPGEQAVESDDEDAVSTADAATFSDETGEGLREYKDLSLADFQTIIRGSLTIGADVNVASSLESLTHLVQDCTQAQDASIILRNDDGQHIIATSVSATQAVTVYETPPLLVDADDPALLAVATHGASRSSGPSTDAEAADHASSIAVSDCLAREAATERCLSRPALLASCERNAFRHLPPDLDPRTVDRRDLRRKHPSQRVRAGQTCCSRRSSVASVHRPRQQPALPQPSGASCCNPVRKPSSLI